MRVLVCGGRDYDDAGRANSVLGLLDRVIRSGGSGRGIDVIIQGGASGADRLARLWAEANGRDCETYHADWQQYGGAAGPRRNQRMLDEGRPNVVLAFPGGRGTEDMVRRARRARVPVFRVWPRSDSADAQ